MRLRGLLACRAPVVPLNLAQEHSPHRGREASVVRNPQLAAPLELVARYESVCVYRKDEPALVLTGISARILSELVRPDGHGNIELLLERDDIVRDEA